jgi:hypothetical protein
MTSAAGGERRRRLSAHQDTGAEDFAWLTTQLAGDPTRMMSPGWQLGMLDGAIGGARLREASEGCPSIGTDGELPAAGEEAIFKHYGLTYEPGAGGERRLACR